MLRQHVDQICRVFTIQSTIINTYIVNLTSVVVAGARCAAVGGPTAVTITRPRTSMVVFT